ncbi:phosphotransferase [Streptomyces sp. CC228A]|uniref:phosphotransferase n=1 Tax=Streptomyces sp. CC228A TaxID=2898186 RepID=UPI001F213685|nr:phosphotransferase [Streptomyces sp. CC228A]
MTVPAPAGSEEWVRRVLTAHWGDRWGARTLSPLTVGGAAPLTHTAGLWAVTDPRRPSRGAGAPGHVLKVQLNPEAVRDERFPRLKDRVTAHCRDRGVPALPAVPAADGSPAVRCGGLVCELVPRSAGTALRPGTATPEQAAAIVETGLDLRQALDALPQDLAGELAAVHLPPLVDEEHWPTALDDAVRRLLPEAERGTDHWHRAAARTLRAVRDSAPLLPRNTDSGAPARRAVVHGDLHLHHFLLAPHGPARVLAVLDFDNLHTGDRLLDLAWLADTAVHACGPGTEAARLALDGFVSAGRRRGLLRPGDTERLMPLLMAHSLPVLADIAKDILDRRILAPQWLGYFDLLSPARRLAVHRMLTDRPARTAAH